MSEKINSSGWIRLHRKILEWEWSSEPNMVSVFIHLLVLANYETKTWKGITINRGQFIFGLDSLAKKVGISPQQLRTCLTRLKSTNEITIKSTNKFSILTIVKYSDYQSEGFQSTDKSTDTLTYEQQTNNKQITTTKEYKNIRKKEYKEIAILDLPNFIDEKLWKEFLLMRDKKKKPTTQYAQDLLLKKLSKFHQQGENTSEILQQSIIKCYEDVYSIPKQGASHERVRDSAEQLFSKYSN